MTIENGEEAVTSEEDLIRLLRVSEGAVLIGGQALAFWVAYFGLEIPEGPRAYISGDADFLGLTEHVKTFSRAIGGRALYPSRHGFTAIHGAVSKTTNEGNQIAVDVLRQVVGVPASDVRNRAIEVHHPKEPGLRFLVMEPVDCMVSRIENLRKLSEKQNEVGVWQGRISISVCREYLKQLVTVGEERKAIRAATAILKLAGAAVGLQALSKFGLDLLDAIPVASFTSEPFKKEQYARMVARILAVRSAKRPA